jgi:hypothetical protein
MRNVLSFEFVKSVSLYRTGLLYSCKPHPSCYPQGHSVTMGSSVGAGRKERYQAWEI